MIAPKIPISTSLGFESVFNPLQFLAPLKRMHANAPELLFRLSLTLETMIPSLLPLCPLDSQVVDAKRLSTSPTSDFSLCEGWTLDTWLAGFFQLERFGTGPDRSGVMYPFHL